MSVVVRGMVVVVRRATLQAHLEPDEVVWAEGEVVLQHAPGEAVHHHAQEGDVLPRVQGVRPLVGQLCGTEGERGGVGDVSQPRPAPLSVSVCPAPGRGTGKSRGAPARGGCRRRCSPLRRTRRHRAAPSARTPRRWWRRGRRGREGGAGRTLPAAEPPGLRTGGARRSIAGRPHEASRARRVEGQSRAGQRDALDGLAQAVSASASPYASPTRWAAVAILSAKGQRTGTPTLRSSAAARLSVASAMRSASRRAGRRWTCPGVTGRARGGDGGGPRPVSPTGTNEVPKRPPRTASVVWLSCRRALAASASARQSTSTVCIHSREGSKPSMTSLET